MTKIKNTSTSNDAGRKAKEKSKVKDSGKDPFLMDKKILNTISKEDSNRQVSRPSLEDKENLKKTLFMELLKSKIKKTTMDPQTIVDIVFSTLVNSM